MQDDLPPVDALPVMPDLEAILALHGAQFVRCAYRRLLVREPEPPGLAAYRRELLAGTPKIVLLDAIASSKEGRELGIRPHGLMRAVRLHRLSRMPLLGRLVQRVFGIDGDSVFERRLRAVEELLLGSADVCRTGAVPSAHGTTYGRYEGRRGSGVAAPRPADSMPPTGGDETALLVVHAVDGELAPQVADYVAAAAGHGIEVVLVIASRGPVPSLPHDLRSRLNGLVMLSDQGNDIASWAEVIRRFPALTAARILWLANDRVLGPFDEGRFAAVVEQVRASAADAVGITDRQALREDSQQHFLVLKSASLSNPALHNFFNRIEGAQSAVPMDGLRHESLASLLRARSLVVDFLADAPPMAVAGVPVPAAGNVRRNPVDGRGRSGSGRVALIGPWNHDGPAGKAARGFVAALWHTDLGVNLYAIRAPFGERRGLVPTVDCRSFSGDADLVVVALDPGLWTQVLGADHWSMLARARKVVGWWSTQAEHPSPSSRAGLAACDLIWAPSRHCAERQRELTEVPVEVMPCCVGTVPTGRDAARRAALRRDLGLSPDQRVIVCCLGGGGDLAADDPWSLLAAFDRAALAGEGWVLVIVAPPAEASGDARRLHEAAGTMRGVIVRDRAMAGSTVDDWLGLSDVCASAHRSRAFGWSLARAMALGRIVVATDYGGSRDFLDASCGYPVPYELRTLDEDHAPYAKGDVWAEVDIGAMAAALRSAAAAVVAGDDSLAQAARRRIEARHSPRPVARALQRAVLALLGAGE